MKRSVQFLAATLTAALLAIPAHAQGKVGVIDLQKVFDNFWRTKQVEAANDPALSNDEKEKRRKELEKKRKDIVDMENNLKQFQQNSQKTLMEQKFRVRDSILREVRGVIEEKAKAGGYNMILDTAAMSANQTPFVLYSTVVGGENDLSEGVAKQLSATAPAETPKADAPKADAPKTEEKK